MPLHHPPLGTWLVIRYYCNPPHTIGIIIINMVILLQHTIMIPIMNMVMHSSIHIWDHDCEYCNPFHTMLGYLLWTWWYLPPCTIESMIGNMLMHLWWHAIIENVKLGIWKAPTKIFKKGIDGKQLARNTNNKSLEEKVGYNTMNNSLLLKWS